MRPAAISVDIWGDFACFTQPDAKIERVSYDVITPSAARGILCSIYIKPLEFFYEIVGIEVMKPIKKISIRKNEVRNKAQFVKNDITAIDASAVRTQRTTIYLRDVYYRIHANIHMTNEILEKKITKNDIIKQFNSRIENGKCFRQPSLGLNECLCYFSPINNEMTAIQDSKDLGIMLYDVFDIDDNTVLNTNKKERSGHTNIRYYHPYMLNGIISVPAYESCEIFSVKE